MGINIFYLLTITGECAFSFHLKFLNKSFISTKFSKWSMFLLYKIYDVEVYLFKELDLMYIYYFISVSHLQLPMDCLFPKFL